MKNYLKLFLILLFINQTSIVTAQFNEQLLEQLIHKNINKVRDSLHLSALNWDNSLYKPAQIQTRYIKEKQELTHNQRKKKYATLGDRVKETNCTHKKWGENIAYIGIRQNDYIDYEKLAKQFVRNWVHSKGHFANISTVDFVNSGISVLYDDETGRVYATQVFGGEKSNFEVSTIPTDIYNYTQLNSTTCDKCETRFDSVKHDIEFSFVRKQNDIYFYCSDITLLKYWLPSNRYSISGDIILRQQFPCDTTNRIHDSPYFDGIPLPPIKISKLLKNNLLKTNSLKTFVYTLPTFKDDSTDLEINTYILRKKRVKKHQYICHKFIHSPSYSCKLDIMKPTFLFNKKDSITVLTNKRILRFSIPFQKSKYTYQKEDIQPLIDSIKTNKFTIKKLMINAFSSVEGDSAINHSLQEKRAESISEVFQSFQTEEIKKVIKSSENWNQFNNDLKKTIYANEFSKLNKLEIKNALKIDSVAKFFEPLLEKHRKALLWIEIEEKFLLKDSLPKLFHNYEKAIKDTLLKEEKRVSIQKFLLPHLIDSSSNLDQFISITIPFIKKNYQLTHNYNLINFNLDYFPKSDKIDTMLVWSASNPTVLYDNYNMLVHYLYYNINYLNSNLKIDKYKSGIKRLENCKEINKGDFNKLWVNYHILLSEYYKINNNYKLKTKAVKVVFDFYKKCNLSENDVLILSNFLVYYRNLSLAKSFLKPYTEKFNINHDLLFYYLGILIFDNTAEGDSEFTKKMQIAQKINPERFCQLFGYPAFSFQLLRNASIKNLYCNYCSKFEYPRAESIQDLDTKLKIVPIK